MTKLTSKQAKFVASMQIDGDQTKAAINAGYSVKSAPELGCRLMKNPKIIDELDKWKVKKGQEISKEDLIDHAMSDYRELEVTESNKPRFLELSGKLLGHLGNQDNRPNQTLNMTLNLTGSESAQELWQLTRKLLGDDSE